MDLGIHYYKVKDLNLVGSLNCDWDRSSNDRKSPSIYVFNLGSNEVAWSIKKQETIFLSSSKA